MAAMILTASCGNNDKDPVTPQPSPGNDTPAQTTGEETVTVPFTIKVSNGNKLTKEADLNQTIFNSEDVGKKAMTVTSATYTDVTGTLNLCYDENNGYYYFDGEISCNKTNMVNLTNGTIKLTGTYGTALEAPMYAASYNDLLSTCNRLFKSDFVFNSTELTLTDQNTYLEITMSKTQFTLDVKSGGDEAAAVTCKLNADGQVWVAVPSGTPLQVGSFLTKKSSELEPSVKHTINRSNLVDVGIPGILWSDHNIGATDPWDYGDYFAWGETTTKDEYMRDWSNYAHWKDDGFTKYTTAVGDGKPDLETGENGDDVANKTDKTQVMPSAQDFQDLKDKCYWVWSDNYNGKSGYIVYKDKGDGASYKEAEDTHIFIPAAGFRYDVILDDPGEVGSYWSSSLYTGYPGYAHELYFESGDVDPEGYTGRYCGFPVRAVRRSSGL